MNPSASLSFSNLRVVVWVLAFLWSFADVVLFRLDRLQLLGVVAAPCIKGCPISVVRHRVFGLFLWCAWVALPGGVLNCWFGGQPWPSSSFPFMAVRLVWPLSAAWAGKGEKGEE